MMYIEITSKKIVKITRISSTQFQSRKNEKVLCINSILSGKNDKNVA